MAMANAELVNGAVPISTDFVHFSTSLYLSSNKCWIKTRSMPFALAGAYETMCDTSFLAETSYKVNNCLWVAVHPKVTIYIICLQHCSLLNPHFNGFTKIRSWRWHPSSFPCLVMCYLEMWLKPCFGDW